jgi:transcriptional regulator with XRE-family HTH domain
MNNRTINKISSDESHDLKNGEIGRRLRTARKKRGLSQSDLAKAIGVSFQQIQKYENGTNRISASRLADFAEILNAPILWLYTHISNNNWIHHGVAGMAEGGQVPLEDIPAPKYDMQAQYDSMELINICEKITDPQKRQALIEVAKSMISK